MKKRYVLAILAALMLSVTGCGGSSENTESAAGEETEDTAEESADAEKEESADSAYDPILYEDLKSNLITLGEYKGLEVTKTVAEVTDEDVQTEVDSRKKSYAELETVDRAAELGDTVIIDYTGYVDGETQDGMQDTEYALELGSGTFIPGFEDQLVGSTADSDVEVNVTFPEDYHATDLAGKDAVFEVHVHEVQAYDLSAMDDAFIKENFGYDDEAALEEAVREELEQSAQDDAESELEYALVEKLLEGCEFEIDDADVEAYTDQMMSEYVAYAEMYNTDLDTFIETNLGVTVDALREMYSQTANFRVQMTLVFHEIAEAEGLKASEEEYQARLDEIAEQYGYENGAQVEEAYSRDMIEEELIQQKVLDFLAENAVVS